MSDRGGFDPPTGPPAGWYPDPFDPTRQRYWDGRAWDMTVAGSATTPTGELPDIGDWLQLSFRSAFQRWRAVLPVAIVTSLIPTVLGFVGLARLADGLVIVDDELDGWTSDRLPVVIVLLVLAVVFTGIGTLALTRLMLDTVDGDGPHTTAAEFAAGGRALVSSLAVIPRAIGWGMVVIVACFLYFLALLAFAAASPALGVVLFLVSIPFLVWLGVKWAFVLVAIVDRRGEPFGRSSQVSARRWWPTLGRLVLLSIVVWMISLAIQLAAAIVTGGEFSAFSTDSQFQVDGTSTEPIVLDDDLDLGAGVIAVSAVTSTIATLLVSSVVASATAVLYRTRNPRD